ncbi:vanadium-dependent haloperoxidase [Flavihumibacter fluvii]|uniref:vanadium-dependent haloperoxidase n=1 Tax=Flavihumibacter fluvii TaxID=2838157 RepID=UPI001BDF4EDC|nr:vanadium-dependent haloperoxidase [Flavihumibacter fluvii]ULQ52352.1 vanadium-dependent haloperoxidase [Flavihumibacter fluvii]
MKHSFYSWLTISSLALVSISSCKQEDKSATLNDPLLFCSTVKKLNDVVLENNFPPMIASRNYAYATIAAYEVVAAGDPTHFQSLAGQIKHLPALPKPANAGEIDYPLAAMLAFTKVGNAVTFPEGSMMGYFDELLHMADSLGMPSGKIKGSRAFADTIAASIMEWSKKDNYAQTRSATRYTVNTDSGRWVPTPPMYAQAIEPHWSEIRPMVLDSASMCRAEMPPAYNMQDKNGAFYKAVMEVKQIGDSLSDEQKHIADFWDDNPFKMNVSGHVMFATKKFSPPGHWMNIVGIAAKTIGADFNTTVAAYAKTAITLFDGFISCWESKYMYNYIRPETVINQQIDASWRPYIQTPPFPSFPSGHATVSAAAAETMTSVFGNELRFTDTSQLEFGISSREITSFRNASAEAAMSRLYGGIHFRFDNELGISSGKKVGELIVSKLTLKK